MVPSVLKLEHSSESPGGLTEYRLLDASFRIPEATRNAKPTPIQLAQGLNFLELLMGVCLLVYLVFSRTYLWTIFLGWFKRNCTKKPSLSCDPYGTLDFLSNYLIGRKLLYNTEYGVYQLA